MKDFILALQFLTAIPLWPARPVDEKRLSKCTAYFPLVGILLGLILLVLNRFLSLLSVERLLSDVILVVALIILTGGLHLDGLADTMDALSSRKPLPQMLRIMREPHIGAIGALSLISVILIKITAIHSLDLEVIGASLVSMCLLGRYSLVFSIFLFPYARQEGKAKVFIDGMSPKIFSLATMMTALLSFIILGFKGVVILLMVMLFAFLAGRTVSNKLGGISGDSLGAIDELTEVFVLLAIIILGRLWV